MYLSKNAAHEKCDMTHNFHIRLTSFSNNINFTTSRSLKKKREKKEEKKEEKEEEENKERQHVVKIT